MYTIKIINFTSCAFPLCMEKHCQMLILKFNQNGHVSFVKIVNIIAAFFHYHWQETMILSVVYYVCQILCHVSWKMFVCNCKLHLRLLNSEWMFQHISTLKLVFGSNDMLIGWINIFWLEWAIKEFIPNNKLEKETRDIMKKGTMYDDILSKLNLK